MSKMTLLGMSGLALLALAAVAGVAYSSGARANAPTKSDVSTANGAREVPHASATFKGNNFNLQATSASCKKNDDCTLTLRLEAQGAYHINDSYPYKFTPGPTKDGKPENVEFAKATFSKAEGDFKKEGEKVATMTVKFKPTAAVGTIAGIYKISVCSEQNCQLEQQEVTLKVDAK
jgi:hypothetical protein